MRLVPEREDDSRVKCDTKVRGKATDWMIYEVTGAQPKQGFMLGETGVRPTHSAAKSHFVRVSAAGHALSSPLQPLFLFKRKWVPHSNTCVLCGIICHPFCLWQLWAKDYSQDFCLHPMNACLQSSNPSTQLWILLHWDNMLAGICCWPETQVAAILSAEAYLLRDHVTHACPHIFQGHRSSTELLNVKFSSKKNSPLKASNSVRPGDG